jgi:hypothetical protein
VPTLLIEETFPVSDGRPHVPQDVALSGKYRKKWQLIGGLEFEDRRNFHCIKIAHSKIAHVDALPFTLK